VHELTIFLLAAATTLYAAGVWRRARLRDVDRHALACFVLALAVMVAALLSPLHHLAEERLWAHMVQHELVMVVAAPLFIAARPIGTLAWMVPLRIPKSLCDPGVAFTVHALAIWLWHIPGLFEASVASPVLHLTQHASFFVSALMFWESVLRGPGKGVASLFATMMHTGALGALMALAGRGWYAGYTLEDQQLAGLVMWVPAGLAYPIAAMLIVSRTLRRCAT
jgi:cytochrome c oxidase assembly factor CtaG